MKTLSLLLGISMGTAIEYEVRSPGGGYGVRDAAPKAGTFQYKEDSRAQ
jgi:hypothetical protein